MTTSLTRNGNPPFPWRKRPTVRKKCKRVGISTTKRRVAEPDTRDCVCSRRSTTSVARRRAFSSLRTSPAAAASPLSPEGGSTTSSARGTLGPSPHHPLLAECRPPSSISPSRVPLRGSPYPSPPPRAASRARRRGGLLGYASVNLCLDMSVPVAAARTPPPPPRNPRERTDVVASIRPALETRASAPRGPPAPVPPGRTPPRTPTRHPPETRRVRRERRKTETETETETGGFG